MRLLAIIIIFPLCFYTTVLVSCNTQKTIIYCKIITLQSNIPTIKGFKYYVERPGVGLDSIYSPRKDLKIGQYYPFYGKQK